MRHTTGSDGLLSSMGVDKTPTSTMSAVRIQTLRFEVERDGGRYNQARNKIREVL